MIAPVLPESAPFSDDQRNWLNGFFAGLANINGSQIKNGSESTPSMVPAPTNPIPALPILILFGSQSGTTEGLAQALGEKLKRLGVSQGLSAQLNPKVLGMDHFREVDWTSETHVFALTSTWGDGEMPDNAVAFWNWLKTTDAPSLSHLNFSVLGLGDKNYARYCQAGKNLDQRFAELGGKRLLPLCECDTDYESKSENWMTEVSTSLEAWLPANAKISNLNLSSQKLAQPDLTLPGQVETPPSIHASMPSQSSNSNPTLVYNRKNPFPAPLLENHPLNAKGSSKDTRHFAFSLLGSGLEYKVGDALGVVPGNSYELADGIINALKCYGNEKVILDGGIEITLRSALISKLDLRRGSDKLLFHIRQECSHTDEKRRLDDLLNEDGVKARLYLAERDVLDVLLDFPHTRLGAQPFAASLSKIAPRLYSISSSPNTNPGEVHLTVAVVRYSHAGRRRLGVASSFLAERIPLGMTVPVFIQPTAHFTLPKESGVPIIMVGPGTGVAPFRAFLQERGFHGDTGKNWLFFGDQHRQYDYLYSDEFSAMESSGFLTRLDLAFSRDQDEKIYVQTRMLEQSKELYAWLESGAYFYVCGDAKRMAKDVEEALLQVIAKESGQGPEAARIYLDMLKNQKRYQRDVY